MTNAADFRRIALALPGAAEYPHFDRRAFKARITFATLAPDGLTANIKFAPDEQALKCAVAPDAFAALENAWGRQGWTRATLAALSEPELEAALKWPGGTARPRPRAADSVTAITADRGFLAHEGAEMVRSAVRLSRGRNEGGRDEAGLWMFHYFACDA